MQGLGFTVMPQTLQIVQSTLPNITDHMFVLKCCSHARHQELDLFLSLDYARIIYELPQTIPYGSQSLSTFLICCIGTKYGQSVHDLIDKSTDEGPLECIHWPLAWRLLFYTSSPFEPELVLLDASEEEAVVENAHTRKPRDTSPSNNGQALMLHKRKRGCSPSTMYKKHRSASPQSSHTQHHVASLIPDPHPWRSYPCVRRPFIVTTDRGLWCNYSMPLTFGGEETEIPRPPKRPASSAFTDTPSYQPNHHPARDLCYHISKRSRHALVGKESQAIERFTADLQGRMARCRRSGTMQNIPTSWTHKATRGCVEEAQPGKGPIHLQGGHGVGGQSRASSNRRELLYLSDLMMPKGLPLIHLPKTWILTFLNEDSNPDCMGLPTTTRLSCCTIQSPSELRICGVTLPFRLLQLFQSITLTWTDLGLC
ncbi:hypothetical protein C8Q74DRAFT_45111 [Fomes fomentarius]|nr:hypothetical protein C8Q74DRAFT_45111 [Fomes fomentarius]